MTKPPGPPRPDPASLPYRAAVGVMLLNKRGHVFVGRRIDRETEAWQMPQGGIDPGEEPEIAVFRELREEIGTDNAKIMAETEDWLTYDLPPQLVGRVWRGRYRGQRQKWYVMRFAGRDEDIDLNTGHPEFEAWRWVPMPELPNLIVPFKRAIYVELVSRFKHLAVPEAVGR
jgi:putative (di)nucleoside polyphosphate hydrolase